MATLTQSIADTWRGLERGTRTVFAVAAILVVVAAGWGMFVVLREDYRALFTQLSDGDAAAIVESLKKQKVPYKLADGGATINVPANRVHDIRLGLMASNVTLSGNVGFELFDKQGLGATEQSQRVSYQRALQGELARTISTLENVKQARVHLVLPESSLFKRDKQESTAAVTLTMKPGVSLERAQVIGVQRLVAASVPGLDPGRVTIADHRGVTLSTASAPAGENAAGSRDFATIEARLELQREVEAHVAQKVSKALDRAYGPGQAIISVAVALSFDAIKTTTQDLIPVRGANSGVTEGGLTRRRQTTSGGEPVMTADGATGATQRSTSTVEVEYDYGRRIEEVMASPGAIKRMTLGVILPHNIEADEQASLREFAIVAAGLDLARGDLISIQSLATAHERAQREQALADGALSESAEDASEAAASKTMLDRNAVTAIAIGLIVTVALVIVAILSGRFRRRALSDQERNQILADIKRALGDDTRAAPFPSKQL